MELSKDILPIAESRGVAVPKYDPASVTPGIFHFGVGNFHRAHLGYYLDELCNKFPSERKWGVVGSSVRPDPTESKKNMLAEQDWLQTLIARDESKVEARILGSMVDYVAITDKEDTSPIVDALLNPDIKIVSMTITEGGYYLNPNTGTFDRDNPAILKDAKNIDKASTIFGLIVKALKLRKEKGLPAFTVMSCDNVPHNGNVCRDATVGLAQLVDKDLAKWIEENVSFPNSMVDRIASATSDRAREFVQETYGLKDDAPVLSEPFVQWVIEDNFCQGRPAFEKLSSIRFVDDVEPFERMKIRILNGGHASLCYAAALLGIEYVHEAVEHPVIGPFLDTVERNEIIPTVGEVPDVDLLEYWKTIQSRFSNSSLHETIERNVAQGSDRQTKFVIPVIEENIRSGNSVKGLATVSALWCRYCQGKTERGKVIEPNDSIWDRLNEKAMKAVENPSEWLEMEDIYGDCAKDRAFVQHFTYALNTIHAEGVEAAMKKYVDSFTTAEAA